MRSVVNKLKTLIKNLTIQCVRLKEKVIQLRKEKKRLSDDVEFYKGKIKNNQVLGERDVEKISERQQELYQQNRARKRACKTEEDILSLIHI